MIERLTVRNLILVDELELEFSAGFNVLTGETGAGKSVLVGALSLLFGARGGSDLVRRGADEAVVAGEFRVAGHDESLAWLAARDIEPSDGRVLVRRTIRTSGRGTIYMQSVPVTLADLEEFAGMLLDLHSQHEHQSLFIETHHRRLLDRFAAIESDVAEFSERFAELSSLRSDLAEIEERARDRERETEMLAFAIEEIDGAALQPGEVEANEQERDRMTQFERLAGHIDGCGRLLDDGDGAALAAVKQASHELRAAARVDDSLSSQADRLESAFLELEDIAQSIAGYREELLFDPVRLDEIETRLAEVRKLQRKYGDSVEEIFAYRERAEANLGTLRDSDERRETLRSRIGTLEQELMQQARAIHEARSEAAEGLAERITAILAELAMEAARFSVAVEAKMNERGRMVTGPNGADKVRFLIAPNPGESARPLSRIASGGEISRVMLAIKTVLSDVDSTRSLVFDEIDTGIGGQVALAIAAHMRHLADATQVICITHLATIAVRADNHIVVEKSNDGGRTRVTARRVEGTGRKREVARMLAGDTDETTSLDHAASLLERYQRDANGQDQQ